MNTNPILNSPIMGYAHHKIILDAEAKPHDYEYIEVNATFEKLTGLRASEIIGCTVRKVIPGIDNAEFDWIAYYGDIALNGGESEFEQYSEPLDKWYRVHVSSAEHMTFTTVFIDITASKKHIAEMMEAKTKYQSLVDNIPGITYRCLNDADWTMIYISKQVDTITGYSESELINNAVTSYGELILLEDRELVSSAVLSAIAEASSWEIEYRIRHKDGSIRWAYEKGSAVFDELGAMEYLDGFIIDNTERKQTEEALMASEANFRAFFDSMQDMIVVGTPDGRVLYANGAIISTLGYSLEELNELGVLGVHPADKQAEAEEIFAAMFCGERNYCPLPVQSKSGKLIPVETRVSFGKWDGEDVIFGIIKDLSKEQEALQKFDKLFDVNPAMMALSRMPERKFVEVNRAFLAKLGLTRAEVIGKTAMELALFVDPDAMRRTGEQLNRDGIINNIEIKIRAKSGDLRDGLFSGEIVEVQGVKYLLTVMIDITERKQAEEAVAKAKEQYALAVRGTNDGIWDWNLQTNVLFLSERWKEILGYADYELKNEFNTFASLIVEEDAAYVSQYVEEYLSGKIDKYFVEFRMKHKSGADVWILAKGEAIRDAQGKPYRMAGSHSDITERKRAEEATKESAMRLALATQASNVGVWDLDIVSNNLVWDDQMYALYGISRDTYDDAYESWQIGLHPEDMDRVDNEIQLAIDGERAFDTEFRIILPGGFIHRIRAMAMVIRESDGRPLHMIGTNWDITEQKRNEEALQKFAQDIEWKNWALEQEIDSRKETEFLLKAAVEEARRANKAKSDFLANMSHEIRTPLNSILGFSEVMLNYTDDEKSRNYLRTILSSGRALLSLINDILDLSKIEADRLEISPEPTNIKVLIQEIKQIFEQKASEKGISLIVEIDSKFPNEITIDDLRLRQILLNLVGNAIKFTHAGHVKIKLYVMKIEEDTIDFSIAIEDSGIGIPERDRDLIFEAFAQQSAHTARAYGGTGLGLAITQRLCRLMDAVIRLDSELNSGSTFTVVFKNVNYSDGDSKLEERSNSISDAEFAGAKIMIVDDVQFNLELVVSFLEDYNLSLITADSGYRAIELAQSELPDLILMDIRMPGISGYETTKRIKAIDATKHIPIVALTASVLQSETEEINRLFDGYLQKPVQKKSVINELSRFIEHTIIDAEDVEMLATSFEEPISDEIRADFRETFASDIFDMMEVMMLDEIQEFADTLAVFAEKHNNMQIRNIANRFASAVANFNVDAILNETNNIKQLFTETME